MPTENSNRAAEDAALDRVLAFAPAEGALGLQAVTNRILERALNEPRAAASNVVPLGRGRPEHHGFARTALWPVAAALAASLVLGIVGGASSLGEPALSALIEVAGLADAPTDTLDAFPSEPPFEELL